MILSLLAGIVVGYVLAIPPGPVGVTVLKSAMRGDKKCGVSIAAGAGFMDIFFCLLAILATTALFETLQSFFADYPVAMVGFQAVVVLGTVGYGILQFRTPKSAADVPQPKQPRLSQLAIRLQQNGPFFLGVGIALTNIASPTFLPSLCYTTMSVQHFGLVSASILGGVLFAIGFGFGNFAWSYTLLRVILHFRSRFSPALTVRIHQFAGLTMIGVGTYLGYRVLLVTKWAELIRAALAF